MMWGYGTTYTWGGMMLMILSMLFGLALLGALTWALVRWLTRSSAPTTTPGNPSALEILQQRYARGRSMMPPLRGCGNNLWVPHPH
jgi:hypothetical protein